MEYIEVINHRLTIDPNFLVDILVDIFINGVNGSYNPPILTFDPNRSMFHQGGSFFQPPPRGAWTLWLLHLSYWFLASSKLMPMAHGAILNNSSPKCPMETPWMRSWEYSMCWSHFGGGIYIYIYIPWSSSSLSISNLLLPGKPIYQVTSPLVPYIGNWKMRVYMYISS